MSKLKINGELDINSYLTAISDLYLSSADGASIIFRNGTAEAGRITSNGYLQLGGTSTGAYRLYVNGSSYFTGTNYLYGTTYGRYLYPSSNGSYALGSSSQVWGSAYIKYLYIYDSTNKKSVGSFYASTLGTTSAYGISRLTIGNSYGSGTAGNAYGVLRIYSTASTYGDLRSSGGGATHYLPSTGGTLLNTGNYNSYVPKKDGTGATGTWAIDISGNAATATKLETARTLTIGATGKTFDGSANISWTPYEMRLTRAQYNVGTNMNQIADHGCELGMANLSGTDTNINPGGGTSWHHYINMTWSDCIDNNGDASNEWCTQIATKAGTTDLWVRSRSGGSITDGTAWAANWTRILTGSNYTSVLDGRYVNVAGDTMTGNLTVPSVYTSNWFRSTGKTGWYSESYGGGWYMTDSSYIRSYNQKAIYLGNSVYIGTSAGAGTGIALYSSQAPDTYGIHMSYTSTYGTHGAVTGDWANYFCFSGSTNRGWIFRQAGSNVASVSGSGVIYANSYIYTNSYLQANTHLYLTSTTSKMYMRYNSTWYPIIENHANGNVTFDACGGFVYPAYSNRSLGIILSANTYGSSLPTTNLQTGRIFYKT